MIQSSHSNSMSLHPILPSTRKPDYHKMHVRTLRGRMVLLVFTTAIIMSCVFILYEFKMTSMLEVVTSDGASHAISSSTPLSPIHVAFGLSGNHSGFLSEFEVSLKSVLLHTPLERNLSVHILADQDAYNSLPDIFNRTELSLWVTRNPVEIHAYDVTQDLPWLKRQIKETFSFALDKKFTDE